MSDLNCPSVNYNQQWQKSDILLFLLCFHIHKYSWYFRLGGLGIVLFTIAHILYINSFGFKNINYALAFVLYTVFFAVGYYLYPYLIKVSPGLCIGAEVYLFLLFTMMWRAFDRFGLFSFDSFPSFGGSFGNIYSGIIPKHQMPTFN